MNPEKAKYWIVRYQILNGEYTYPGRHLMRATNETIARRINEFFKDFFDGGHMRDGTLYDAWEEQALMIKGWSPLSKTEYKVLREHI